MHMGASQQTSTPEKVFFMEHFNRFDAKHVSVHWKLCLQQYSCGFRLTAEINLESIVALVGNCYLGWTFKTMAYIKCNFQLLSLKLFSKYFIVCSHLNSSISLSLSLSSKPIFYWEHKMSARALGLPNQIFRRPHTFGNWKISSCALWLNYCHWIGFQTRIAFIPVTGYKTTTTYKHTLQHSTSCIHILIEIQLIMFFHLLGAQSLYYRPITICRDIESIHIHFAKLLISFHMLYFIQWLQFP